MTAHVCPCGGRLWTREELLATGDAMDRHVAEAYLGGSVPSGYCDDEDEIVPLGYAAEIVRRQQDPSTCQCGEVPLDFPLRP